MSIQTSVLVALLQVEQVQLNFVTNYPSRALVFHKRLAGVWTPWQYYAPNCGALGLPGDGQGITFDSVFCTK